MMVKIALKLFKAYEDEIAGIDPDLKETVQADRKLEINKKYAKAIGQAKANLEIEANRLAGELAKAQDPKVQIVKQALSHTNIYEESKIPDTVKAVMGALPVMDEDMLDIVAEQAKHPALLLGLYTQANRIEDVIKAASLRQQILSRVAIPPGPVKQFATAERECLDALYVGVDICTHKGHNQAKKLDFGRRIAELDKLLAG